MYMYILHVTGIYTVCTGMYICKYICYMLSTLYVQVCTYVHVHTTCYLHCMYICTCTCYMLFTLYVQVCTYMYVQVCTYVHVHATCYLHCMYRYVHMYMYLPISCCVTHVLFVIYVIPPYSIGWFSICLSK